MKLKKIIKAIFALMILILVSACNDEGTNEVSSQDDETVLTFYSWDGRSIFEPVIEDFEEKNPGVKIEFSHKPPVEEYISGLQTTLLSGTAADVFLMGAENKSSLINSENVIDLTDYEFMDRLNESNKEGYSQDGRVYAASISSWGGGIGYNKDLLKEVGYEEFPSTWEDFIQLSKDLKDNGITPYFEGAQSGNFMSLYALIGGNYYYNEGNKDDEIFEGNTTFHNEYNQALNMWSRLIEEEILTTDVLGLSDDQIMSEFSNGNVAMVGMGPWNVSTVRDSNPELDFSIAPVPGEIEGQLFAAGAPSPGYAINPNAKNVDLAEQFVEYMTTPEAAEVYNGDGSSNNMYTTEGTEQINEGLDSALDEINIVVQEGKIYLPATSWRSNQDELTTTFQAGLQEVIGGYKTTDQVLKELDDKLAEIKN